MGLGDHINNSPVPHQALRRPVESGMQVMELIKINSFHP